MTMQPILEETRVFLNLLGLNEEPFGVHYSDTKPENAYGPKKGIPISRELEESGKLDMQEVMKTFSCVMGNIWLARKKVVRPLFLPKSMAVWVESTTVQ